MSLLPAHDEKTLLRLLADSNQDALTAIYHAHWQSLFLSAYAVLKDKKACEDIVQDVFLQLWLRRENLEVRCTLKTYLSSAVRYQVFHHIRKCGKAPILQEDFQESSLTENADEALLRKDFYIKVHEVVEELPEKCRLIYRLSREEQLSHKEIAERLNISIKTVENQLTIALRRLRHGLRDFSLTSLVFLFFWF